LLQRPASLAANRMLCAVLLLFTGAAHSKFNIPEV